MMSTKKSEDLPAPFWDHVGELRSVCLKSFLVIGIAFFLSLFFYQNLFVFLTKPLNVNTQTVRQIIQHEKVINQGKTPIEVEVHSDKILDSSGILEMSKRVIQVQPNGYVIYQKEKPPNTLVVLGPSEGVMVVLKICFWVSLTSSSPIWLLFLMQFISPALRAPEKVRILPFLILSFTFMGLGMLFAYSVTIPLANHYLQAFNRHIGENLWTVGHYLNYSLILIFATGLSFECCVILGFLVHFQVITEKMMIKYRRYAYVGIMIACAIVTPPDVLTQILLALPLIGLYEISIFYAKFCRRPANSVILSHFFLI